MWEHPEVAIRRGVGYWRASEWAALPRTKGEQLMKHQSGVLPLEKEPKHDQGPH
jgi:hypothetical protein